MGSKYKDRQAKTEGKIRVAVFGQNGEQAAKKFYMDNPNIEIIQPKWKKLFVAPKESRKYDVIYSHMTLQRISHYYSVEAAAAWASVVLPGGDIHITVPSMEWAAEQLLPPGTQSQFVWQHIFGLGRTAEEINMTGFTMDRLRSVMEEAGIMVYYARAYKYIQSWKNGDEEYSAEAEVLHCSGKKAGLTKEDN